jgi:small subunit ribosomal protein S20
LAHHKSAIKRIRQSEKRRIRNRHIRSTLRSSLKKIGQSIEEQNVGEIKARLDKTISIVDRTARKGIIHKNKAARQVSRMKRKANALLAASPDA